jgi:hypothetical protein
MTVVGLLTRAGLRARWRSWLVLAVLTGLAGGLVTAVAAGARRTDAAYPALVAWSRAPDDLVSVGTGSGSSIGASYANLPMGTVGRFPQVTSSAPFASYTVLQPSSATLMAPLNDAIPGTLWHKKLLAGRLPAAGSPDEVDVSFTVPQASPQLRVGSALPLVLLGATGKPVSVVLRVVGIEAAPGEFPPQYGPGVDFIWATPAFVRVYGARLLDSPGVVVRLRHGAADIPALDQEISRMAGGKFISGYPFEPQALAVGIPVGLLCGRQAWRFFAGQLGISDVTRAPVLSFVLLAVAGLALAVAIALVPAISASRIRPADALRAE